MALSGQSALLNLGVVVTIGSVFICERAIVMKIKLFQLLVLIFVIHTAVQAQAQTSNNSREADHVALKALRDRVITAMDHQDMKALATCFAKDFAFTTINQTVLTNEAQMAEFYQRMFQGNDALLISLKTEPKEEIPTRFLSDNTGICYGTSKDTYTMKSGKVVTMNNRWSATVVKENGEWKVATAHFGTDFLNNPVLEGVTSFWKNLIYIAGSIGLVVGGLLGWILGRRRKNIPA